MDCSVEEGKAWVHLGRCLSLPALTRGLQTLCRGQILWNLFNHGLLVKHKKDEVVCFEWN